MPAGQYSSGKESGRAGENSGDHNRRVKSRAVLWPKLLPQWAR
jgi:hypothetical protein